VWRGGGRGLVEERDGTTTEEGEGEEAVVADWEGTAAEEDGGARAVRAWHLDFLKYPHMAHPM
jgi:hypothetical protein